MAKLVHSLVLLLLLVCAGCDSGAEPVAGAVGSGITSYDLGAGPLPPGQPKAVLPASAGAVDLVAALLPVERVCALPSAALRYSGLGHSGSPHLSLPTFGVYESERVLAHGPDLVLAHSWQKLDTTLRLRGAGVPVAVLKDAHGWPAIRRQIEEVGVLLDAAPEASRLVQQTEQRMADLERSWKGRRQPTALCYTNGGTGGWVAGADTTNDEALRLAGLRNLAAETGRQGHAEISFEELLRLDPDVIVVSGPSDSTHPGGTAQLLRTASMLAGLSALRHDRIVILEAALYTTTSHHVVEAALEIARQVEPFRDQVQ